MLRKWFRRRLDSDKPRAAEEEQEEAILVAVALERIGGPPELQWMFIDILDADIQRGLDGWKWIGLEGLTAVAISAFGDVFFRTPEGTIQMLDTIEGSLKEVAESLAHLTAQLQETGTRDDLLLGGFVNAARAKGMRLGEGECYDFEVAPVLGGKMSLEATHKHSFVVKLHIAGQLHEQVKDLPPGTRISRVTMSD